MKKLISFLCRMPGIFIITIIALVVSLLIHWQQIDDRWWLPTVMAIVMTFYCNFYLFFIQGEKTGSYIKGSKWLPIILIGIMTLVCIGGLISIKQETKIEFPGDHAVQSIMWESMACVLLWAWFALFWNMNLSASNSPVFKSIPPNTVRKANKLIE